MCPAIKSQTLQDLMVQPGIDHRCPMEQFVPETMTTVEQVAPSMGLSAADSAFVSLLDELMEGTGF